MPSSIAWLDTTVEQQRRARELLALFAQHENRDELGLGQIRDAFSNLLFPGTSVLQTRARYYLFIPWCYRYGRAVGTHGQENRDIGQRQERELIATLRAAGDAADTAGLIGSRVGPSVKTLPSTIYWGGMETYSIRRAAGEAGSLGAGESQDGDTELSEHRPTEWDDGVPLPAWKRFPREVVGGFTLTRTEAEWLHSRMVTAAPDSVLAALLQRDRLIPEDLTTPWDVIAEQHFPELTQARRFSQLMEGAPLLYNLLVAERYDDAGFTRHNGLAKSYAGRLGAWWDSLRSSTDDDILDWDLGDLWLIVGRENANIDYRTKLFVAEWLKGLCVSNVPLDRNQELRDLVSNREQAKKGNQSRLANPKMLGTWSGAAGVGQLTYRWPNVRRIVNDVLAGLGHARS